jgi:peptidoglycan/xylan/chitin deacetylase (PgdA/CDA1 family)
VAALLAAWGVARGPVASAQPSPGRLPDAETIVWHGLTRAGNATGVAAVEVLTNGRLTIAGIKLTYRLLGVSDPAGRLRRRAAAAAAAAFTAVPALDQVHVSGFYLEDGVFDYRRRDVTFSAAFRRQDLADLAAARFWVHPALQAATVDERIRMLETRRYPPEPGRAAPEPAGVFAGIATEWPGPAQRLETPMRRLPTRVIFRGSPTARAVALTFDDGPDPIYTTLLLDTLDHLGLRATFFLIGDRVEAFPYFARDIAAAGHELGNHSFHHVNLARLPLLDLDREIGATQQIIEQTTGAAPRYFRPPGGHYNRGVLQTASAHGLTTVFWTDNPADYTLAGTAALQAKLLGRASNGGIILLHQGVDEMLRVLPHAVDALRQRGLAVVPIGALPR